MNAPSLSTVAFLDRRRAGMLLHPTSLPAGDLGADAYRFVDFLVASGFSVWQFLPIGPTHGEFGSTYQCLSVHAGNPQLISSQWLVEDGWLGAEAAAGVQRLQHAHDGFTRAASQQERAQYAEFRRVHAPWLEDYALYQALRGEQKLQHWVDWPAPLRDRDAGALHAARTRLVAAIEQVRFEQFVFFRQWQRLKDYANRKGVLLFGDLPIFVAHDSADVWAQREQFAVNAHGQLQSLAGVPPDYFSNTGQLWGNPHYHWPRHLAENFRWWNQRFHSQIELMDLVRIDHFRGFEAYWEIPAGASTAIDGRWVSAPGDVLFSSVRAHCQQLRIVAEDLGVITPEVTALRRKHGFPGMKILQFAFEGGARNPYLPHCHEVDSVVYTGTHDNDTTLGWFNALPDELKARVYQYLGTPHEAMPWPLIRAALASVSQLAVIPMQDALALDGAHRMNTPGTVEGNWRWRFSWEQIGTQVAERLRNMVEMYAR